MLQVCLLPIILAGCERRDRSGATPPGTDASAEAPADSAAPLTGPSASRSRITIAPADAPTAASGTDTALVATQQELATLSAGLVVPVQGIARSQLRDTFAESRGDDLHEAIDIPAARGTPVLSASDGRLLRLFDSTPGGLMVYATDAAERFILLYGHLDRYADGLTEGMRLERGQVIGYVGTTGNAPPDTPHLHFGILRGRPDVSWWQGAAVNPYPLLIAETTPGTK